jgi:hypothetical protein
LGSLQGRQAAKGPRRVSHRRKTFRVANIRQKSRSEAVRRSRSFETSRQRCRQSLGGDGSVRGTGARRRVGTENAHSTTRSAGRSGRLRREPHRSPTPPGETLGKGTIGSRASIGCSSLICRIANVGRTYLWPWLIGAERHEPRPWSSRTRTEAHIDVVSRGSVRRTGTQRFLTSSGQPSEERRLANETLHEL